MITADMSSLEQKIFFEARYKESASRYEKENNDFIHYGNNNRDNGAKTALDAVSYLARSTKNSSQLTLNSKTTEMLKDLIKKNTLTFYHIKDYASTKGDLKRIRELALENIKLRV